MTKQISVSEELFTISKYTRLPLIANFELTANCNLDCIHCYHTEKKQKDLSTSEIYLILEKIRKAGTMFLVLTGGEIFLREDISKILYRARDLEFAVTIFTNAICIDEKILNILKEITPFSVQVSLYSLDPEQHDRITRFAGSHNMTMQNIQRLREAGQNLVVKSTVMEENLSAISDLKTWACREQIDLKIDPFIAPCFSHDMNRLLGHRLAVDKISGIFKNTFDKSTFRARKSIECSAGRNMFAIDPRGEVLPCIAWRESAGNILKDEFDLIWNKILPKYENFLNCEKCPDLPYCGMCPGVASIEGKQVFCDLAKKVRKIVKN